MAGIDVCVSAAPYFYNLVLARTAVENRVHFCDLAATPRLFLKELRLDMRKRVRTGSPLFRIAVISRNDERPCGARRLQAEENRPD
jgi:hypothetical protein